MNERLWHGLKRRPELAAELTRRGLFSASENREVSRYVPALNSKLAEMPLGSVQFATLLAQVDAQLAARVVLHDLARPDELVWLDRLLRFKTPNGKRDELCRIVERALEGRKGNVHNLRRKAR